MGIRKDWGLARLAVCASLEGLPSQGFSLTEAIQAKAQKTLKDAELLSQAVVTGWDVHTVSVGSQLNRWIVADKHFLTAQEAAEEIQKLGASANKLAFFPSGSAQNSQAHEVLFVSQDSIIISDENRTMLTPDGLIITK